MTYRLLEDPGHAWLEVPIAELISLGIDEKVSSYSYLSGRHAYLEEDCDMPLYVAAKLGRNPRDWRQAYVLVDEEEYLDWCQSNVQHVEASARGMAAYNAALVY